jgi:hypothetical protein
MDASVALSVPAAPSCCNTMLPLGGVLADQVLPLKPVSLCVPYQTCKSTG